MKNRFLLIAVLILPSGLFAQQGITEKYSWDALPDIQRPVFKKDTVNITDHNAVGDGIYMNTLAINAAITQCSKKGGGVVLIPHGIWKTGPVYLKSNVNLHLERGATLFFTADKSQYKIVEGDYEGRSAARNESPINAKGLSNIAITGKGIIDGNGEPWRAVNISQLTMAEWKQKIASGGVLSDDGKVWYPSEQYKHAQIEAKSMLLTPGKNLDSFLEIKDFLRPNLLVLKNCRKVLIEGVTLQNSAAWCLHPIMCEDLTISGVTVKNPDFAQNGDGMDIESCRNFLVENSTLDVGDDAICIKSGKDEEGRKRGIPTENGIIRGNTVYSGHGGVVIGSEMSGGARNIFIENCTFLGTDKGLRFKSTRGRGGIVENIYVRNVFMKDIVQQAIFFDMLYFVKFATDSERDNTPQVNQGTPIFRNMIFDRIFCNGAATGLFIRGLSEMNIQNITLSNAVLKADIGAELSQATGITLKNVRLVTKQTAAVLSVNNSKKLNFDMLQYDRGVDVLLSLDGENIHQINIINTDLKLAKKQLELKNGASEKSVTLN
jgi:polygalacturonase